MHLRPSGIHMTTYKKKKTSRFFLVDFIILILYIFYEK